MLPQFTDLLSLLIPTTVTGEIALIDVRAGRMKIALDAATHRFNITIKDYTFYGKDVTCSGVTISANSFFYLLQSLFT